ncbi:MAG TPA: hypothetical protein VN493_30220 [Thermoanaerobaculia bacterium]|nr:hypothetical protein [Thermoanaerobaculia bacterium]
MKIELWAVDAAGGRAIIRQGDRWFLVSKDQDWQLVAAGGRARAFAWFLSPAMVLVRQPCSRFAEALLEARRVCAAGGAPPGVVRRFMGRIAKPLGGSAAESWEEQFPAIIHYYSDRLDKFFRLRGCSARLSFDLSLKAFLRLFAEGPQDTEERLSHLLREIASDLCPFERRTPEAPDQSPSATRPLNEVEVAGLTRLLLRLELRLLRCLYFWAALRKSHEDTATLMRLSVNDVQVRLVQIAAGIGCMIDDLRSPEMVEACTRALKGKRR